MFRRRPFQPPATCRLCNEPVTMSIIHTSALHGKDVCTSACANLHMIETCIDVTEEEVCPVCETAAVKQCNCVQQTKTCANGHAWLVCMKCRHVTTRPLGAHIRRCDACHPPGITVDTAATAGLNRRQSSWWRFAACYKK